MAALLIIIGAIVLLGVALGFLLAVSLGMKDDDSQHAVTRNSTQSPLARAGRRLVGLSVRQYDDTAPQMTDAAARSAEYAPN